MISPNLFLIQATGGSGGFSGLLIFQLLAMVAIFYFLLLRPKMQQEKRHRERLQQLRKGDQVATAGGLLGKIVHLTDTEVTLKTGEAKVIVARDRIAEIKGDTKTDSGASK